MIESELFGHEKGSFTGASERRAGCFEVAQHGTLLLDEIGEMPLQTQAKLLRILEDSKVRRLGGKAEFEVDVRVVAATNKVPEEAVRGGHLREDLYYRLNVFQIHMPPLRERKADIPMLAEALLADLNRKHECRVTEISADVLEAFERHNWPGNVRELRNVLERAVILAGEGAIERQHLPAFLQSGSAPAVSPAGRRLRSRGRAGGADAVRFAVGTTVEEAEKGLILRTLEHTRNNKTRAAEILGISLKTLHNKLKEYGGTKEEEGGRYSTRPYGHAGDGRLAAGVQVVVDGVERQFQAVGNSQLIEDVVQVVLHRLLTDEHLLGHLFVLETLRHQRHDFPLALAERGAFAVAGSRLGVGAAFRPRPRTAGSRRR